MDRDKVFRIKDRIEGSTNEKCWIDIDGIESDAQFKNVIISAIKDCEVVLFMYSKAHSEIIDFEKDWTVREINFAANKNKRIVFVNLDGTPLTDEFSFDYGQKQQVDGKSEEAIARLIADLNKWLESTSGNGPTPDLPSDDVVTATNKGKSLQLSLLGKRKGCVVAVSIIASVFLLAVPSLWIFNSPSTSPVSSSKIPTNLHSASPSLNPSPNEIDNEVNLAGKDLGLPSATLENEYNLAAIDLGLPSGTLWANMNLGARIESDFGDFFAWEESETKQTYSEFNYVKDSKNKTMKGRHDAAYTILGSEWRTPCGNDFKELIENCSWCWTTRNGHNGYEVKGRNGNTIFLPASGWIDTDIVEYRNEYGYYWTSDRVNDEFAKELLFSKSVKTIGCGYLHYGRSIRPVIHKE